MASTPIIAARVRQHREARGWSARRLAEECAEAGMPHMDRDIIANLENGRRQKVSVDELVTLAGIFGVTPDSLHRQAPEIQDRPAYVIVRMPKTLHAAFKARAEKDERSFCAAVRHACQLYLAEAEAADRYGRPGEPRTDRTGYGDLPYPTNSPLRGRCVDDAVPPH